RTDAAVEGEFSEDDPICDRLLRDDALCRKDAEGDGKIKGRAGLTQMTRSQIDGDACERERVARVAQGGTHPFTAFAHSGVGKADNGELWQPTGDVDFDPDRYGLAAYNGCRSDCRRHDLSCLQFHTR